jgi:hypothetical protein
MPALVHVVAANLSSRTQLKAPKWAHACTFFGAKTAPTFIRLRADLLNGPHPHSINFSVRRSVSDYRPSSYVLAGYILRTNFSCASWKRQQGAKPMSALPPNANVDGRHPNVCFVPIADIPLASGLKMKRPPTETTLLIVFFSLFYSFLRHINTCGNVPPDITVLDIPVAGNCVGRNES